VLIIFGISARRVISMKIIRTEDIIVKYNVAISDEERDRLKEAESKVAFDWDESDYNEFLLTWDGVLQFAQILGWSDAAVSKLKGDMINAPIASP